ncbi:hypothetical protein OROGR_014848 [Orobanche gracilis]
MSVLNQLFNRGLLGAKCKTCLTLAISRIKLLQNKRDVQLKLMRKEIVDFLQAGQEAIARIRVEHVIREQNTWEAYLILELFCELVLARVPILESQRECPIELREAVASIIFSAPRCSDIPDLLHVRNLFSVKYGKEFIAAASELRPDTSIIEKLSVSAPPPHLKLKVLKEIAREYNINWDSIATETEFSKKPEDLLFMVVRVRRTKCERFIYILAKRQPRSDEMKPYLLDLIVPYFYSCTSENGPKQIALHTDANSTPKIPDVSSTMEHSAVSFNSEQVDRHLPSSASFVGPTSIEPSTKKRTVESITENKNVSLQPSDVLQMARNAIAAAERASTAARAASKLVNIGFKTFERKS